MSNETYTVTGLRARAHIIWDEVRKIEREDNNWSTTELIISDALRAAPDSAKTSDEWLELGCVLNGLPKTEQLNQYKRRAFRNLKKAGYLSTRCWYEQSQQRGVPGRMLTLYEIAAD